MWDCWARCGASCMRSGIVECGANHAGAGCAGIAEALIATAIGLSPPFLPVIAYNRFTADIDRLATRYESFMEEFTNILQRQATH